jgi:hypothetical protein
VPDCATVLDPVFPQPYIPNGSARLGCGLVFKALSGAPALPSGTEAR